MARIRRSRDGKVLRVTLSGRLSIADMRRLEHACAPALTSNPVNLEIDFGACRMPIQRRPRWSLAWSREARVSDGLFTAETETTPGLVA